MYAGLMYVKTIDSAGEVVYFFANTCKKVINLLCFLRTDTKSITLYAPIVFQRSM